MAKSVGGQGSAPDPAGGAYDALAPSRLRRGHPSPGPTPLSAFGASISILGASKFVPSALNFGVPIVVNLRNDHWLNTVTWLATWTLLRRAGRFELFASHEHVWCQTADGYSLLMHNNAANSVTNHTAYTFHAVVDSVLPWHINRNK